MPSFTDLIADQATVIIPTRSDPLEVVYRPGAVTPRQFAQALRWQGVDLSTLSDDDKAAANRMSTQMLATMVIRWNLTMPDGTPVVPTIEGLQDVDYSAQAVILQAIKEDQSGPKSTMPAAASVDGSIVPTAASSTDTSSVEPLADSSPVSPNGTASTPLPTGLVSAS